MLATPRSPGYPGEFLFFNCKTNRSSNAPSASRRGWDERLPGVFLDSERPAKRTFATRILHKTAVRDCGATIHPRPKGDGAFLPSASKNVIFVMK